MLARGHKLGWLAAWVALGAGPVAAQESGTGSAPVSARALVAPVQGSEALRVEHGDSVLGAVRRALEGRGYETTASHELLGQAVVACQTPECVEQVLDAAAAALAIVPAVWSQQSGGKELTLTLVERSGRSLNASGVVGEDLLETVGDLVDQLLERRAGTVPAPAPESAYPHAWKAGPVVLIVGGVGAFVAVGVAAGIKSDNQQLNPGAVAAWSAVGVAAIAGGIAWWVVGEKRHRRKAESPGALSAAIGLRPSGIDLRLRF